MYKYLLVGCVLTIALCLSCGDQSLDEISLDMGEEYLSSESGIVLIDTLSVTTSTVIIDSVMTSYSGTALVGGFNDEDDDGDEDFGQIYCDAIFRFETPGVQVIDEDDIFDSIVLCMQYNAYYLGDTTLTNTFTVEQVSTDMIDILEDKDRTYDYFFNTSTVSTTSDVLATYTYTPRPSETDTVKIRLDDTLGQDWLDLFESKDDTLITESDRFLDYFKGIKLKSDRDNSNSVIGFTIDETMCIRLHYHRTTDIKTTEVIQFTVKEDEAYQFNSIEAERPSDLAALVTQKENLSSAYTDDLSFIQGSTGLMTKVNFPGLESINQLPALDQIVKAELVLYPTELIEQNINDLPSYLSVYESNDNNVINDQITDSSGDIVYMYLGYTTTNEENDYYYTVDITNELVNELLDDVYDEEFSFLVRLNTTIENNTTTSISFEGHNNTEFKPKLRLYTYYY